MFLEFDYKTQSTNIVGDKISLVGSTHLLYIVKTTLTGVIALLKRPIFLKQVYILFVTPLGYVCEENGPKRWLEPSHS